MNETLVNDYKVKITRTLSTKTAYQHDYCDWNPSGPYSKKI